MATIISKTGSIVLDGKYSAPKGAFSVKTLADGQVRITSFDGRNNWVVDPLTTTIDGVTFSDAESFVEALADFSRGGTGPGAEMVQTVTGDGVDNTDPTNPVISASDSSEPGSLVKYSNIGAVNTATPQFPENAVNLAFLNSRLSEAQRLALDALVSPASDYVDMAEATAAIKSIIDALKAT